MSYQKSESVCVKSCATVQEAELVCGLLEAGGVHARISADDYIGIPMMASGSVEVFVLEDVLPKAQEILAAASSR